MESTAETAAPLRKRFCQACNKLSVDVKPYKDTELKTCKTCAERTDLQVVECEAEGCEVFEEDSRKCGECYMLVCPNHTANCGKHSHCLCPQHTHCCTVCEDTYCDDCGFKCPKCHLFACYACIETCLKCNDDYCQNCIQTHICT
jgi:hypothetical protein